MAQSTRDALQDGIALLGTALASISAGGMLPASMGTLAAGGGALAIVAMIEKAWRNNREQIIDEIEDLVEDITGLDIELDEVVDEIVEKGIEVATDVAEDGDLDKPLSEVADELKDSLKDLSVKELKSQLKERGLPIDGKKAELIKRLIE